MKKNVLGEENIGTDATVSEFYFKVKPHWSDEREMGVMVIYSPLAELI